MFKRIVLRRHLSRLVREGNLTKKQKEAVTQTLFNSELFDVVAEGVADQHAQLKGGGLTDFFDWLLDHMDEIIALIMKLLPLFTEAEKSVGQVSDVE